MAQIHVTVIDKTTGKPAYEFFGFQEQLDLNLLDTQTTVEGAKGGDWYADGEWHTKPEAPNSYCTWDWDTHAWVDARTDEEKAADDAAELSEAKAAKLSEIDAALNKAIAEKTGEYPESEKATWSLQTAESAVWEAAAEADRTETLVPWCAACASVRGEDLTDFMTKLAEKISAYRAASAALVGKRQKLVKEVEAAATADEVNAISWE